MGYTDSSAIETLRRLSAPLVVWPVTAKRGEAPDEARERRTRENVSIADEEKALERERGRHSPCQVERPGTSGGGPWEPHERKTGPSRFVRAARRRRDGPKGRPAWIWVKQAVERVRNPADGECREWLFSRVVRAPRSGNAL